MKRLFPSLLLAASVASCFQPAHADEFKVYSLACHPGYLCDVWEVPEQPVHQSRQGCDVVAESFNRAYQLDHVVRWVCLNEAEKGVAAQSTLPFRAPAPNRQP